MLGLWGVKDSGFGLSSVEGFVGTRAWIQSLWLERSRSGGGGGGVEGSIASSSSARHTPKPI